MLIALAGKVALYSLLPALILISLLLSGGNGDPPDRKIFIKFLFGGAIILIPAAFLVGIISPFFDDQTGILRFLSPFFAVSLIEETAKLSVIRFLLKRLPQSRSTEKAMTLSASAAIGFAMGENILYMAGTSGFFPVMVIRGISALPLHTLCGAMMGAFISKSLQQERGFNPRTIILPLLCHGIYNTFLRLPSFWPLLIFPLLFYMFLFLMKLKGSIENN
ncbi:MAG: PrsW family intramembrane metalloprotease [Spirochaetales bacterium]|nr:PrsW family intramembrane metalloprotease [Spirochaetales bacterium]